MQLLTRPLKQLYERVYITIIRYIFPTIRIEGRIVHTAQKMKSSIKDFLRVSCGFGYTYWRHLWWKTFAQWRMYIDLKRCLELIMSLSSTMNPFVSNTLFLYLLKASENRKDFWCFQEVEKGYIGNEIQYLERMYSKTIFCWGKNIDNFLW